MEEETIELTKELIRIPSENPTGTEAAVAERVEAYLRGLGVEVERDPVVDGRENLIAEVGGSANGPALVFLNHMDTVPVGEGWTRDPFGAREEDGRIWGRGSCDMKGGLAAGLTALKSLKARLDRGARAARAVRCCLVVDEEGPWMRGVSAAIDRERIGPRDVVLSCEPTGLRLMTAQKGAMWYEVLITGKSAHAAAPHMGADAVQAAARTVIGLRERGAALSADHPLLGGSTVVTSVIAGGRKTNVVADGCRLEVDVRFVPPLTVPDARALVEAAAAEACAEVPGTSAEVRPLSVDRPPILADPEAEGARLIGEAFRAATGGEIETGGVSYYSDAGLVAARTENRQCFLFGPGNIEQAHAPDEFIDVDELRSAARVLGRLAEKFALENP